MLTQCDGLTVTDWTMDFTPLHSTLLSAARARQPTPAHYLEQILELSLEENNTNHPQSVTTTSYTSPARCSACWREERGERVGVRCEAGGGTVSEMVMMRSSQVISEYFTISYRDSIIMRGMAGHRSHQTTATVTLRLSSELFFAINIVVI